MMRESGKLSLLTMISRVLGLIREMTRTWLLGTGPLAEAFSAAFNVPNLFRKLLAEGAMSVALIPTMRGYFAEGDDEKTREFLSATLSILTFLLLAIMALGMAGSLGIARLYEAMARDPSLVTDSAETAALIRLMFPYLAFVSLAAFFQGILNAHGVFVPTGIGPILFNLSFLAIPPLVVGFLPNAARAMAVGVLVGGFLQALCQLPAVVRTGARFGFVSIRRAFRNPGMKRVMLLMAPTLVGTAAYELNAFVSTGLAYGVGAATSIQISLRLQELILGVFVVSVATVLLPELSLRAAQRQHVQLVAGFRRAIEGVMLVSVPIAVFSIIQRRNIVAVLFQSGRFGPDSVAQTASAFLFHSLGLVFIAANRVITPVFYARQDTKNPTWAGVASFCVNMLLAWALSGVMGGQGIALALSIASAVNTAVLLFMLMRMGLPGMGATLVASAGYALRLLVYSLVAAAPLVLFGQRFASLFASSQSRFVFAGLPLLLSTFVFGGLGCLLLFVTKDPVARSLLAVFKRKTIR